MSIISITLEMESAEQERLNFGPLMPFPQQERLWGVKLTEVRGQTIDCGASTGQKWQRCKAKFNPRLHR